MIVSGIVFLAVMDGMALFGRYAGRKTDEITANMRLWEGYGLMRHLAAVSDSVSGWDGSIELFRRDSLAAEIFATPDSMLIARRTTRTDTLMEGISELRVAGTDARTGVDSICMRVRTPDGGSIAISFPITPSTSRLAVWRLGQREKQYAYE